MLVIDSHGDLLDVPEHFSVDMRAAFCAGFWLLDELGMWDVALCKPCLPVAHGGPVLDVCKITLIAVRQISAYMAPARCVGLWVTSALSAANIVTLFAAEICGAIVGGFLVCYLNYLS